ncbi:vestigial like family member 4 [Phyllostomus discolor]|uniref:Vestigial like family member 4 n=1 Tax=Phyllostomus discolor TaxID=89673 RepID=A0A834E2M1_9CHIR|nr:vestigial like family member 4 [Phyllostomus discolor]
MLFMKMDLLNYQYLDKMNNNIGILCYEGEAALRGEPRMQTIPVVSALTSHRTGPPPISPSKRKFGMEQGDDDLDCENDHASKISRIFNPHLNKTANGDCRKDPRERSRSPIERAVAPTMSLHGNHLYTSLPSLSMEQPLALTKNYKEPEPAPNSVSITGSVDDHFAKALGDTWLQIKAAKDGAASSPESASRRGQSASPSAHMVSHSHSPSVVS